MKHEINVSAHGIDVRVSLPAEMLRAPMPGHSDWLTRRATGELVNEIKHLDELVASFRHGGNRPHMSSHSNLLNGTIEQSSNQLLIAGQQVMQDWERPYMEAMARAVVEHGGSALEVGFGMGISASLIQGDGVASHTIIESNPQIAENARLWRNTYPERDIIIVEGRWQDVISDLGVYDAILFDTYPMNEEEQEKYYVRDTTFAAHFFEAAAAHLRRGGLFTYYSNEIDSLGRGHQRRILEHFTSVSVEVIRPVNPPEDCHYWWANSIVLIKAYK